jgi:uncharacterized membrane protein (UPF0127 family)
MTLWGCGDGDAPVSPETPAPSATALVTPTPPETVTIQIRDLVVEAETAVTPEERGEGLSNRPSMPRNEGMLFYLIQERIPGFHMNEMQFPLDFVWISADGVVVDLTENVPEPAVAGETISGISPREAVLYTLELNAGVIDEAGLEIGDSVTFTPNILQ